MLFVEVLTYPNIGASMYLPEVNAPKNYKDPVKIADYVAKGVVKQTNDMPFDIDFCQVAGVAAFGHDTNIVIAVPHDNLAAEKEALERFWKVFRAEMSVHGSDLIGYNIDRFGYPVLLRRAWAATVDVNLYAPLERSRIIDLMQTMYHHGYAPTKVDGKRWRSLVFLAERYSLVDDVAIEHMRDHEKMGTAGLELDEIRQVITDRVVAITALYEKAGGAYTF